MMYKLIDGVLCPAPKVHKGIVGFNSNTDAMIRDGWKPLKNIGEGVETKLIERADCIEVVHFNHESGYKTRRAEAYPPVGDVIDALLKAYQGNPAELEAIIAKREAIKKSIKKND